MIKYIRFLIQSNFGADKEYYKKINKIFGIYPNNIELYKLAMIHKSASIVLEDGSSMNNERLEYLGDAVIECVVSDMLYVDYPMKDEGFLTQLRSRIVNRNTLNSLAVTIGLDECVVTQNSQYNGSKHINGDAFEAMIGAIYLDMGYDYTNRLLINRIFRNNLNIDKIMETENDHKSRLIEWCQKKRRKISIVCNQDNDYNDSDTLPQFVAVININGKECGYGVGHSKKEAEQRAAQNTIAKMNIVI